MVKKDVDSLLEIQERLNNISSDKVRFSNLEQVNDGQYSFTVGFTKDSEVGDIFNNMSRDQISRLIRQNKPPKNTILGSYSSKENKIVAEKLRKAGLQDLEEAKNKNTLLQTAEAVSNFNKEVATSLDERFKDSLRRKSNLDLGQETPDKIEALELYERSEEEYLRRGIYGTALDILSNFSATGFHNESSNTDIKLFYDAWVQDTNFDDLIVRIFHNLYKYSVVYLLPGLGNYEVNKENVSSLPGQELNTKVIAKAKIKLQNFFKKHNLKVPEKAIENAIYKAIMKEQASVSNVPISYTIIDPKQVEIHSTGFFGAQTLVIKSSALEGIADLESRKQEGKISKKEIELLKLIPSKIKQAAKENEDYIDKDNLIQTIYLRKNDFEAYSKPRGSRAFDSFDYKEELVKADYATLDGIFNQILKVTVGDKDNPVTDVATLDAIAEAFDTPQKAFTIVWHHALNIEKISNPEVGDILGIKKYEPVNKDITAALGITRALIDGDSISNASAILSSKALQSEIDAARMKVADWVYHQYKIIAKQAKFTTYPYVRWRNSKITTDGDAVTRSSWMQMADRMLVSKRTAQLALGLDPDSELEKMRQEKEILESEGIGIVGSPFQQTKNSPNGADGRPVSQPTGNKNPNDPTKAPSARSKPKSPTQQTVERSKTELNKMKKEELINYILKTQKIDNSTI